MSSCCVGVYMDVCIHACMYTVWLSEHGKGKVELGYVALGESEGGLDGK